MKLPVWHVGRADSGGFVTLAGVSSVIAYLISRDAGRPLRWHHNKLHTAPYRGRQAFVVDQYYRGNWHEPSAADKQCIFDALVEHRNSLPLWRYRHVREMSSAYKRAFSLLKESDSNRIRMNRMSEGLGLAGFRREFMQALNRRINLKVAHEPDFRKCFPEWQQSAYRDSRRIRDHLAHRIAVHSLETEEARRRFGYIVS